MKSSTKSRTGVSTETSTVLLEHLPGGLDAPVPGRDLRPEEDRDDRRQDDARDEPEDQEAAAVAVPGRGRCCGPSVS